MAFRPLAARIDHAVRGASLCLPGWVTAHSHAFQFGLRGRTQRADDATGTFWSWRDAMYRLADALDPESLYTLSRRAFDALAHDGVVAVGEFHYVHHARGGAPYDDRTVMADTVIRAALDAGLRITLLRVAYERAGAGRAPEGAQRRFSDRDVELVLRDVTALANRYRDEPRVRVGVAPHSVRAVSRAWLETIAAYAALHPEMPVHAHVAEQQGEIDACVTEHGVRPVELLADTGVLSPRFTAVHATVLENHEAQLLGRAGSFVCVCPTTERDLGDGLADLASLRANGVRLCTGIDSHVITDALEEMRALETHERLRLRRRVTFTPPEGRTLAEQLLVEGSVHGAASIGFDATVRGRETDWAPSTLVPLKTAHGLEGVPDEDLLDALVFSGTRLRLATEG